MSIAVITGSAGLVGSASARRFAAEGMHVIGIDNHMRGYFFGDDGDTLTTTHQLRDELGDAYTHKDIDIRSQRAIDAVFTRYGSDIELVVHAAGQPSHDWATREPLTDFGINATGTMNVLEATRLRAPEAAFVFCSTNKVYGDRPNDLPLVEHDTRFDLPEGHRYWPGIDESMSIDDCLHSIFGVSKTAADLAVVEYGRYFGMRTAAFRCGTLTGVGHAAAELHGFLAYLMRCAIEGRTYRIFGYDGKQVRDAICCHDLTAAFAAFAADPRPGGQIYNMGGGRDCHTSLIEAIAVAEAITGKPMTTTYIQHARIGDHKWWISDTSRFRRHYPDWRPERDVKTILSQMWQHHATQA